MEKIFYVLVAIKVECSTELTEPDIEEISQEMDYLFTYNENHKQIVDTEIKEVFQSYPTFID